MQYKRFIILLVFFANIFVLTAQEVWIVPDDKKNKLSPFEFTNETKTSGADIFSANCKSCHGDPGKSNFVPLTPPPGDPASAKFQTNTDGELYYKIRTGKVTMPSFSNTLTPDDIWSVISYIRSFNTSYLQEVAKEIKRGNYDGEVSILLTLLKDENLIEAKVIGTKADVIEPMAGVEIKLLAERYFGNLQIGEAKITNKNGIALFEIAKDLPGDTKGKVNLIAQLTDQEAFGVITKNADFPVGKITNEPSLVAERAMWNKMNKAPIWVLLSYTLAVLVVWGIIFSIIFKLRKIYRIGKENI